MMDVYPHINNWFFYLISLGIIVIMIWIIVKYIRNYWVPNDDSFYLLTVDELGRESLIHDSGIRPSKIPPGDIVSVQILKKEYKDGKANDVFKPDHLKMGLNPQNLKWTVYPEDIVEEDTHYTVKIKIPDNSMYGVNMIFPIDKRIECEDFSTPTGL